MKRYLTWQLYGLSRRSYICAKLPDMVMAVLHVGVWQVAMSKVMYNSITDDSRIWVEAGITSNVPRNFAGVTCLHCKNVFLQIPLVKCQLSLSGLTHEKSLYITCARSHKRSSEPFRCCIMVQDVCSLTLIVYSAVVSPDDAAVAPLEPSNTHDLLISIRCPSILPR